MSKHPTENRLNVLSAENSVIEKNAEELGIDEELISKIVDTFYGKIQKDEVLGPIFNGAIKDNWNVHLPRMKIFWSSIILRTGKYAGQPMQVHRQLEGVEPEHFVIWLELFRSTLEELAPSELIVSHFMRRAERIAISLQAGMYGGSK